mmetsp:Transcript_29046/g.58554  ORF Transcript_29046/g.58554 Transcript_29046/m.58554 type:complete len:94 (+) Transcript_29046:294-575(+)
MLMPTSRGPAVIAEFHTESDTNATVKALRANGVEIQEEAYQSATPAAASCSWADLDAQIERISTSQSFRGLMAEVEGVLARRESLGLPDLLER